MKIVISVFGSKDLIADMATNYGHPRVLENPDFKKAFSEVIPQPVIAKNYHIGAVCSVMPIVSNFFLTAPRFLDSPQSAFQIPKLYNLDISLAHRAAESYSIELLPADLKTKYPDIILDMEIQIEGTFLNDMLDHIVESLGCISAEHCFGWHILSYNCQTPFFRQILNIRRPDKITLPEGATLDQSDTDDIIFSYSEQVTIPPDDDDSDSIPLKELFSDYEPELIEPAVCQSFNHRCYWPAHITPVILRESVGKLMQLIYPYAYEIIYEDKPTHSFVCKDAEIFK